jgi:hypothetical protein
MTLVERSRMDMSRDRVRIIADSTLFENREFTN